MTGLILFALLQVVLVAVLPFAVVRRGLVLVALFVAHHWLFKGHPQPGRGFDFSIPFFVYLWALVGIWVVGAALRWGIGLIWPGSLKHGRWLGFARLADRVLALYAGFLAAVGVIVLAAWLFAGVPAVLAVHLAMAVVGLGGLGLAFATSRNIRWLMTGLGVSILGLVGYSWAYPDVILAQVPSRDHWCLESAPLGRAVTERDDLRLLTMVKSRDGSVARHLELVREVGREFWEDAECRRKNPLTWKDGPGKVSYHWSFYRGRFERRELRSQRVQVSERVTASLPAGRTPRPLLCAPVAGGNLGN